MTQNGISARLAAFHNVSSLIEVGARLPARVLSPEWATTRFFESDAVASGTFLSAVHEIFKIEHSTSCCLVNLTRTPILQYDRASSFYVERGTTKEEYIAKWREGGPAAGWIFTMDRYVSASDKGEWCVYCERNNDVALISFHDASAARKYCSALEILSAEPIEALLSDPKLQLVPFNSLVPEWRKGLKENYGNIRFVT